MSNSNGIQRVDAGSLTSTIAVDRVVKAAVKDRGRMIVLHAQSVRVDIVQPDSCIPGAD